MTSLDPTEPDMKIKAGGFSGTHNVEWHPKILETLSPLEEEGLLDVDLLGLQAKVSLATLPLAIALVALAKFRTVLGYKPMIQEYKGIGTKLGQEKMNNFLRKNIKILRAQWGLNEDEDSDED